MNYEDPISPIATGSHISQAAAAQEQAQPASTVARGADTPGVIAPPPLIYLGALGVGFGLDAMIGSAELPSTVARPVGAALIVAGAGLLGTFVRAFGRARTPVDPYTPSQAIVTDGPYRLTRNPGYLVWRSRMPESRSSQTRHGRSSRCRPRSRSSTAVSSRVRSATWSGSSARVTRITSAVSAVGYEPIAHGTVNPYTPYMIPGSHAWPAAIPMLERVNYRRERAAPEQTQSSAFTNMQNSRDGPGQAHEASAVATHAATTSLP